MKKVSICLDVGGTFVKGAIFSREFAEGYTDIHYYPAKSNLSKGEIIKNFQFIFLDLLEPFEESEWNVEKIAIAFPGPFDYEEGISQIKGLGKFDKLYGVNLLNEFIQLQKLPESRQFGEATIFFRNDAEAFAFGENHKSQAESGAYFTIGTGLGSTFIKDKRIVFGKDGIPESGMIYNQPFGKGVVDDYASARGLEKIISKHLFDPMSGEDLFNQAEEGSQIALEIFNEFGMVLGKAINPFITKFQPEEIVFGGQISKSFRFFEHSLRESLNDGFEARVIRISEDTTLSTLEGLFILNEEELGYEKI